MHNLRMMNPDDLFGYDLFEQLLHAEDEDDVERILLDCGLLTDDEHDPKWIALGGIENNFGGVGNQQSDATAALIEKIINSIDAVLMAQCYKADVDPESADAPQSMDMAVERFFGVRDGAIERLSPSAQTALADNIHLIATGTAEKPSYLIVDRGEGQTPNRFPETFLSLFQSNKMRIPFVQGKFNSGGTGVLQFCGEHHRNYQLIASRRHPDCPAKDDPTKDFWGYTLIRRLPPTTSRRNSMYMYLAPGGRVPMFQSAAIYVLSKRRMDKKPDQPYAQPLEFGTCVKLYNYRWRAKSLLTTDGRYELERFLHRSCLPFRVSETRSKYSGNYFSATVNGGWSRAVSGIDAEENAKLEDGFPAWGVLNLPEIGTLPYQIIVFRKGTSARRVPTGIVFAVNGQVHGAMPSDYIGRRLKLDYLKGDGPLLVSVDCTNMEPVKREDFFMASRDRVRKNETYEQIDDALATALRTHEGLQELNQHRRQQAIEQHLKESPVDAFQQILDMDPTLFRLFAGGERLVTGTGPKKDPQVYEGKYFPTFFRLAHEPKGGLEKHCPVNRTCRVDFVTDATNDYFKRLENRGALAVEPVNIIENAHLWNGRFTADFRIPWGGNPGDKIPVTVVVSDLSTESTDTPFVSRFVLVVDPESLVVSSPGPETKPRKPDARRSDKHPSLALPNIVEISKDQWNEFEFDTYTSTRIRHGSDGGFDFFINVDSSYLLTEISESKEKDRDLLKYWFTYGLAIAGIGVIDYTRKHPVERIEDGNDATGDADERSEESLEEIEYYCNGLAKVIIPIVRTLSRSPTLNGSGAND